MNDIIRISQSEIGAEKINTVNARELHSFLKIGKRFPTWMQDRINQYDFEENTDFVVFANSGVNPKGEKSCLPEMGSKIHGGSTRKDYFLSLDMAKEISMVEKNEKGREARKYFIACEKQAKTQIGIDLNNPADLRGLFGDYTEKVLKLEDKIEKDKPKIEAFDNFLNADGLYGLQNAGRAMGAKPNLFSRWLKQDYLFYQGSALVAKARYIQMGLFEVKSTIIDDKARPRTYVMVKGLEYLRKKVPHDILIENRLAS